MALDRAMEIAEKLPTKDEQPDRNTSETEHYQKPGNNQNFSNVLIILSNITNSCLLQKQ
jgi:hypothetical protein